MSLNLKTQMKAKKILRESSKATVDVSQPVATKDKSRFFKAAWEEEKRQLYFR